MTSSERQQRSRSQADARSIHRLPSDQNTSRNYWSTSRRMCNTSIQVAYCVPVDPYSLILAAKRYHAARGALLAVTFVRKHKQSQSLKIEASHQGSTNVSHLPIEVLNRIYDALLQPGEHEDRCDCWIRFSPDYISQVADGCQCLSDIRTTSPGVSNRTTHCPVECKTADACDQDSDQWDLNVEHYDDWISAFATVTRSDIKHSDKGITYHAAVCD